MFFRHDAFIIHRSSCPTITKKIILRCEAHSKKPLPTVQSETLGERLFTGASPRAAPQLITPICAALLSLKGLRAAGYKEERLRRNSYITSLLQLRPGRCRQLLPSKPSTKQNITAYSANSSKLDTTSWIASNRALNSSPRSLSCHAADRSSKYSCISPCTVNKAASA